MAKKIKVRTSMVFERHEKKYLLTEEQCRQLLQRLEGYMQQDMYGLHTICSLYMDSDDFILARRSMQKPNYYKEKLRLRSYGVPNEETTVYLELKKKFNGITYKRRISIPFRDAREYLQTGHTSAVQGQILNEIDYFCRQYKPKPQILLFYERVALHGIEDEELRLTIDKNIRWRSHDLFFENGDQGERILPEDMRLVEIKIPNVFPLWLSRILSELGVYPASFSKYTNAYARLHSIRNEVNQHAQQ